MWRSFSLEQKSYIINILKTRILFCFFINFFNLYVASDLEPGHVDLKPDQFLSKKKTYYIKINSIIILNSSFNSEWTGVNLSFNSILQKYKHNKNAGCGLSHINMLLLDKIVLKQI
jgi:hypothetical protein